MIILVVLGFILGLPIGIWLGRDKMRPLPSFEDKKKQKEKENTLLYESERRRILAEAENLKLRAAEDLRNEVVANRKKLEFEIADLYNEREKLAVVKTTEENIINELRRSISIEKEKLEYLRNSIEEYNASVIQTKIRILRNAKYEKEKELNELKDKYSKMLSETLTAIALIESRMAEWSTAERIAYEERLSREEVAQRNRLGLSVRSIEELKELYEACGKLKLANPTPLYKAIYELYLKGVVKDLGIRCGAVGKCGIYKITNVVNGKTYIGQSVDIAERWKQHIKRGTRCESGTLVGAGLYEAMFEDGIWNFCFQVLEECERESLNTREKLWISHYQSNEIGYNKRV